MGAKFVRTAIFEIRGPESMRVRIAEFKELPGQNGLYNIMIDKQVRYYGAAFTWEEAMDRVKHWEGMCHHGVMSITPLVKKRELVITPPKSHRRGVELF